MQEKRNTIGIEHNIYAHGTFYNQQFYSSKGHRSQSIFNTITKWGEV